MSIRMNVYTIYWWIASIKSECWNDNIMMENQTINPFDRIVEIQSAINNLHNKLFSL